MTSRLALLSATFAAIGPVESALAAQDVPVDVWNIVDDALLRDATASGGLSPKLVSRMESLLRYATDNGADAILLTCSMYGNVVDGLKDQLSIPAYASDEAAFADLCAHSGRRIVVLGTLEAALRDTTRRLTAALAAADRSIDLDPVLVPDALAPSQSGPVERLAQTLSAALATVVGDFDAVMLAQYSLAPAAHVLRSAHPGLAVVSAPESAARALRRALPKGS